MVVTILLCVIVGLIVGYCSFWIGYHKGFDEAVETTAMLFLKKSEEMEAELEEGGNND